MVQGEQDERFNKLFHSGWIDVMGKITSALSFLFSPDCQWLVKKGRTTGSNITENVTNAQNKHMNLVKESRVIG